MIVIPVFSYETSKGSLLSTITVELNLFSALSSSFFFAAFAQAFTAIRVQKIIRKMMMKIRSATGELPP